MPDIRSQQVMSQSTESDSAVLALRELADTCAQELSRLQAEVMEIDVLIKQSQAELERIAPRLAQVSRRVHEVESQPDGFSRAEIRETYSGAQEAQMRSFVMKSQIEQLTYKKTSLQRYDAHLRQVLAALERHPEVGPNTEPSSKPIGPQPRTPTRAVAAAEDDPTLAKVVEAQEHERYLVSQEIHDGPAQVLANLALRAELCEKLMMANDQRSLDELRQIKTSIAGSLRDTRQLVYELRPIVIGELGLIATLQKYLQGLADKRKIAVAVEAEQFDDDLPEHAQLALFRVIQDAVQQSLVRPQVSRLTVRVGAWDDQIGVEVEDDGVVVGSGHMARGAHEQRPRLDWLQDRLRILGALTESETIAGQGNLLRIAIPRPPK